MITRRNVLAGLGVVTAYASIPASARLSVNQLIGFGAENLTVPSPTTWNPSDKGNEVTLSGGNLDISFAGSTNTVVRSIAGKSAGKWYWEVTITGSSGASSAFVGVATSGHTTDTNQLGADIDAGDDGYSYVSTTGDKFNDNSSTSYGNSYTSGDIIGIALDMDVGKVWFAKNGVWQASGNPSTGANEAFSGLTGDIYAGYSANATGWTSTTNFGASSFSYPPPSGYQEGLG